MKKILLVSVILASSNVFAKDVDFDGFYLGAKAGFSQFGLFGNKALEEEKNEIKAKGESTTIVKPYVGLILGYGFSFADDFVGNVNFSSSISSIADDVVLKEVANNVTLVETAISYLQGYAVNNFMPYVGAGYSHLFFINKDGVKESLPGFNVDLGVRYAVNDSWQMGLEYSHKRFFIKEPNIKEEEAKLEEKLSQTLLNVPIKISEEMKNSLLKQAKKELADLPYPSSVYNNSINFNISYHW